MPKHEADELEAAIITALMNSHELDHAIREAMRPHIERVVAENGRLRMALQSALTTDTN